MALTIDNWMVAWNPKHSTSALDALDPTRKAGAVKVGRWPDEKGWSDKFDSTAGCDWTATSKMDLLGKVMMMFIDFHTLVVRDGIDPQVLHKEFLKIDEYRYRIPFDMEGAEDRNAD